MTIVEPRAARQEVARRVQDVLDRYQPRAYRVTVDQDAILEDGDWFHVVVTTTNDVRDRDFYDALASAESDLNEAKDGHEYLLVPAIAD